MTARSSSEATLYYPYIDGLRALAVLSVFVFHLHGPWLPGGFVGVDVFFVISGFVVSASLANLQGRGLWSFLGAFYARRIRRIVPALLVCLLVTAFWLALLVPSSWLSAVNQQTGLYAFWGLSNFILAENGRNYFAPTTEFNPYTHTWSLAVEEQFYLFFPFLFLAWMASSLGRWRSFWIFVAGFILSFVWAIWLGHTQPIQGYFLSPSRFWELAAGVLLYQLHVLRPDFFQINQRPQQYIGWGSLFLLCLAFGFSSQIFCDDAMCVTLQAAFPAPGALPAVLATLGLIYALQANSASPNYLRQLLSQPVLVKIGLLSYSLYLWHWPVFVLFRWTLGLDFLWQQLLAAILAFILAFISYRWVECPIRKSQHIRHVTPLVVITGGIMFVWAGWWTAGYITENQSQLSLSRVVQQPELWYPRGSSIVEGYSGCNGDPSYRQVGQGLLMIYEPRNCVEVRPLEAQSIYVIGDSHALAYEGLFKQFSVRQSVRIYAYNNGGCPFISFNPARDIENKECREHTKMALEDIQNRIKPGDILFLASLRLPRFSDQWAYFGEKYPALQMFSYEAEVGRNRSIAWAIPVLNAFRLQGVQVVFEAPKPIFKASAFRCADWFNRNSLYCQRGFEIPRALLERYRQPILKAFDQIAQQVPGILVWDPFPILCFEDVCKSWQDGKPLFLDGDHLSGFGNLQLLDSFTSFMRNTLRLVILDKD